MNANLLKIRILEENEKENFNGKQKKTLFCSKSTASQKMNGYFNFTVDDIKMLATAYNLSPDDIYKIFFEERTHETIPASVCRPGECEKL